MTTLRFVLGDQLSHTVSSLRDADPDTDVIFMCEVQEEATYVRHHKKKIAFTLSAMRHFREELRSNGHQVRYIELTDPENTHSFTGELERAIAEHEASRVVVTEPGEYRVLEAIRNWTEELDPEIEIRADDRYLCSQSEFAEWAQDRKQLRMENFYRLMRRKTGFLMESDQPVGGEWNFDKENRQSLPKDVALPPPIDFAPDEITQDVLKLVEARFSDHFGDLKDFSFPVTRTDALKLFDHFIEERLLQFGSYQDAMIQGEPTIFHSLVSTALNAGLLNPLELCQRAEAAFFSNDAPINAVEGFIRQILGWREYVRGIYWLKMPEYAESNFLKASRDLPEFYWSGDTKMNCVRQVVLETKENAYAHHIQRLMVTGNFALLFGVEPQQINEWYLAVYADAYEWVQLPNTHGMVMFADGGLLGSKPYAASGSYINKMSDYCEQCTYSPKQKTGPKACPFNYLYWNFIAENRDVLSSNQRMRMIYASFAKMGGDRRQEITQDSAAFFGEIAAE